MSIFSGLYRALGFESEEEPKPKAKIKKTKTKASFNLKKDKAERPDKIDGVKVIYIEGIETCKKAVELLKCDEPVIVNLESAEDKSFCHGYLKGAISMTSGNLAAIEGTKLFILLPEGVEIEKAF